MGTGETFSGRDVGAIHINRCDRNLSGKRFNGIGSHKLEGLNITPQLVSNTKLIELYQEVQLRLERAES